MFIIVHRSTAQLPKALTVSAKINGLVNGNGFFFCKTIGKDKPCFEEILEKQIHFCIV